MPVLPGNASEFFLCYFLGVADLARWAKLTKNYLNIVCWGFIVKIFPSKESKIIRKNGNLLTDFPTSKAPVNCKLWNLQRKGNKFQEGSSRTCGLGGPVRTLIHRLGWLMSAFIGSQLSSFTARSKVNRLQIADVFHIFFIAFFFLFFFLPS